MTPKIFFAICKFMLLIIVVDRIMSPLQHTHQRHPCPNPRTYEYVTSLGKERLCSCD